LSGSIWKGTAGVDAEDTEILGYVSAIKNTRAKMLFCGRGHRFCSDEKHLFVASFSMRKEAELGLALSRISKN
jgi:hypothetical protein